MCLCACLHTHWICVIGNIALWETPFSLEQVMWTQCILPAIYPVLTQRPSCIFTYRPSHGRMLPVWNHLWHQEHVGWDRAVCPSSAWLVLFLVELWTTSSSAPCAEIMVHLRTWKEKCPFQTNHYFSLNTMFLPLPQRRKKMSQNLSRKEGSV